MEVRVLGPLEVRADGEPIALGAPKERSLFALLAVHANEVLSVDRLVDDLWDGEAPDQATAAVRVYVSHLRKVLPADTLVTKGSGYVLVLGPRDLDAAVFGALVSDGRAALASGFITEASSLFREALALVRGRPLADIDATPALESEIVRLEEARLAALECRVEADLACGRHAELVEEVAALVGEYPLREPFWAQLIVALYRCGRQADALRAYQRARATLIDELGIEPGERLRALETAVLNQDPVLDAPQAARIDVHHNLPAERTAFVGREQELASVVDMVRTGGLVTLTGVGGCGKTRLALAVARSLMSEFPDGVVLVELAAVSDPAAVTTAVVATIGLDTRGLTTSLEEHLADFLSRRRMLVVLDNCEHVIDAVAALADVVLSRAERSVLLATSRESLEVDGERAWRVPSMSLPSDADRRSDAIALFVDRATRARPDFALASDNEHDVMQICRRLDGMPLAIELAAARLRMLSVHQIAARLDDRFRLLTGGGRSAVPRQQTLEATMDWSYALLDEDDRVLLARLAVFVGGFTIEAVESVCGAGLDALARLVDKSLVVVGNDRYFLLETVRQYATNKLIAAGEVDDQRTRHRDWYLDLVRPHDPRLVTAQWERLFIDEYDNLRAAIEWSVEHADRDHSLLLAVRLADHCNRTGRYIEGRELLETVEHLAGGTDELALHVLATTASVRWRLGDHEAARRDYESLLDTARQVGAVETIRDNAFAVAIFISLAGRLDEAEALVAEGMAADEATGRASHDWYHYARAFITMLRGDLAASELAHEQAIRDGRAADNVMLLVTALVNQARVVALLGHADRALDLASEAIEVATRFPHTLTSLDWMVTIASAALTAGRADFSRTWSRASLEAYRRTGGTITIAEAIAIAALAHTDAPAEQVAVLLGFATGPGWGAGDFGPRMHAEEIERRRAELEVEMGPDALHAASERGARMTLEDAVTFALSLSS